MKIRAVLDFNLIDYPGKIAAVAFTPGCNYGCPACHAKPLLNEDSLISEDGFFAYLAGVRRWVSGVVICGGEPTLQEGLEEFMARLKAEGLAVKLDTNGSAPALLRRLLERKLADFVALDVKGPAALFASVAGVPETDLAAVMESVKEVARFPAYEFRTTAAPVIRSDGGISFMTAPEIGAAAELIRTLTGSGAHKYYIQKFVPRKGGLLDERLESFPETPPKLLEEMRKAASAYLPECAVR